jgi:hypothetical protein
MEHVTISPADTRIVKTLNVLTKPQIHEPPQFLR